MQKKKNNNNDNNNNNKEYLAAALVFHPFEAGQSNAGVFENENFLHFLGWSEHQLVFYTSRDCFQLWIWSLKEVSKEFLKGSSFFSKNFNSFESQEKNKVTFDRDHKIYLDCQYGLFFHSPFAVQGMQLHSFFFFL